jgi:hypothetical protein
MRAGLAFALLLAARAACAQWSCDVPDAMVDWREGASAPSVARASYRWSACQACEADPGSTPVALQQLEGARLGSSSSDAGAAQAMALSGARCGNSSLRSQGAASTAAAQRARVGGAEGAAFVLWLDFNCPNPSAASSSLSLTLGAAPGGAWFPPSAAFNLTLVASPAARSADATLSWAGCQARARWDEGLWELLSANGRAMVSLSFSASSAGAALGVDVNHATLLTNGAASCSTGASALVTRGAPGALAVSKRASAPGADCFGLGELQVYAQELSPYEINLAAAAANFSLVAAYRAANATLALPAWELQQERGLAVAACAASPPAHRYGGGPAAALNVSAWSGLVWDWGSASPLPGKLLDGGALTGAASVTGTLAVPVPAAAPLWPAGLTLRYLADGPLAGLEWAGFTAYATPDGGLSLTNALSGGFARGLGAGTRARPLSPFLEGEYTTITLSAGGAAV